MHEFEQLEDAVLTALESMTSVSVRTIEPYAGQLEVDDLTRITARFPCIYVIADGLRVVRKNSIDECTMSLMLLIGDKNYRSNSASARGDTIAPGIYAILEAVRGVLHRKKLLTGWSPAYLTAEEPKGYEPRKGLCLYTATYEIQAQRKL